MVHRTRNTTLHRDERGSLVTIGLSLMALFGATMLAIDVGMLMWGRTQAQVSADAGAPAGATALVYNDLRQPLAFGTGGDERYQHRASEPGSGHRTIGDGQLSTSSSATTA